ncbi:hypothetical protein MIZ03_4737 [Rhodoferax lithotrophicus]|uniref:Uncharacterized protein n=1 Tax=Rhodoferax lithotrophicus TaxID=2798804 RepID=A0ABN6DHX6_9BURK|nr:hypothetical protein MIZ03_4737 [Rhodoferax sp. MIZ03]
MAEVPRPHGVDLARLVSSDVIAQNLQTHSTSAANSLK